MPREEKKSSVLYHALISSTFPLFQSLIQSVSTITFNGAREGTLPGILQGGQFKREFKIAVVRF